MFICKDDEEATDEEDEEAMEFATIVGHAERMAWHNVVDGTGLFEGLQPVTADDAAAKEDELEEAVVPVIKRKRIVRRFTRRRRKQPETDDDDYDEPLEKMRRDDDDVPLAERARPCGTA
jgi:hypothetical protein